jgi:hypothetical protein
VIRIRQAGRPESEFTLAAAIADDDSYVPREIVSRVDYAYDYLDRLTGRSAETFGPAAAFREVIFRLSGNVLGQRAFAKAVLGGKISHGWNTDSTRTGEGR